MTPTQFKDCFGRTWDCKLDLKKTMRVDRSDFSVYSPTNHVILTRYDKDTVTELLTNTSLMFAVIACICIDQAKDNLGVTTTDYVDYEEKFVEGIDGSVIEPAREAFVEALGDFFRPMKTALSSSVQKMREYQEKATKRLTELNPILDATVDRMLDQEIEKLKLSIGASGPSLESSASNIGNTSPSENS